MGALRRFAAILVADLRERSRGTRFWVAVALVGIATWWCFPAVETGRFAVGFGDDVRGTYSSAWVGLVLGLMYSSLLSLLGFYLVRGTLVRDFDTRVWQLLVATPMTRPGYLLAKWASHMAVFALLMLVGLVVGAAAQLAHAEDRALNLIELVKPVLVLALPSLAVTAFFAVLFDLVPWLRRTAGNVLFFFVWVLVNASLGSQFDPSKSAWAAQTWLSDPGGMALVMRDLHAPLALATPDVSSHDLSVGMSDAVARLRLFSWNHWPMHLVDLAGRAVWVLLSMACVVVLAPMLDWAAARTRGAEAVRGAGPGRRLAWLDRLLRPLEWFASGRVMAAEFKLVLRHRRVWWWLALLGSWAVQSFGPPEAVGAAVIVAWMASVDVFSRVMLRERETRTGSLLFVAAGAARRLLMARAGMAVVLAMASVAPAVLRTGAIDPLAAMALLLVAGSVACGGLALSVLFRNPRPFELLLAALAYVGVQGQGPLAVLAHPQWTLTLHAVALVASALLLPMLWPRLAR